MKSELTYLLEELECCDENAVLTVGALKALINNAFMNNAKDQQTIDDSMNEIGHDML